ncbi:peptidase A22B, signal peptide peptidase, partial [Fimicolochytrium jonesii]|uniref:peptidase A22B, signal peptide peptidase n=1 Tax=Fimicolochytrium jonesii TaxID=1396493 RepID=UPI0022FE64B8
AYIALGILATAPIYIGSWASIKFLKEKKRGKRSSTPDSDDETADDDQEYFSLEDAYMFPIFGSAALLTLYLVFKYLNKEYLNALFTAYFSILGVGAVSKSALDLTRYLTGWRIKGDYRVDLWKKQKEIATYHFGGFHFFVILLAIVIAGSYAFTKHWVLNNIYGEAFATSAIRLLNLDSFKTGIALLSFLFFYDIFWVFGTDVMVTVAKGFDAPIKVLWPKDIVGMLLHPSTFFKTEGLQFTLLGLGDIVIPGIFVALCLKFDHDRFLASPAGKKNKYARKFPKPYFTACSIAYVTGLVTTVVVMHNFQAAQPALLYLSPACIISVLLTGFLRGELKEVFAFEPG